MLNNIRKCLLVGSLGITFQPVVAKTILAPQIDVNIPQQDLIVDDFVKIMDGLNLLSIQGQTSPTVDTVMQAIDLNFDPDKTAGQVIGSFITSRDDLIGLNCDEERCTAEFTGEKTLVKLNGVKLPGLGEPTLIIEDSVSIDYRIPKTSGTLELCKIKGLVLKAGFISQKLDGLYIETDDEGIAKAFIDVGTAGTYPKSC